MKSRSRVLLLLFFECGVSLANCWVEDECKNCARVHLTMFELMIAMSSGRVLEWNFCRSVFVSHWLCFLHQQLPVNLIFMVPISIYLSKMDFCGHVYNLLVWLFLCSFNGMLSLVLIGGFPRSDYRSRFSLRIQRFVRLDQGFHLSHWVHGPILQPGQYTRYGGLYLLSHYFSSLLGKINLMI